MLTATGLRFAYKPGQDLTFPDIVASNREKVLILGQSGCGKTTLLHILAGILTPDQGTVSLLNKNVYQLSGHQRDAFRGKHIGIIFQQSHFIRSLRVEENLVLAQNLAGLPTDKKRIHEILQRLQLDHKAHKRTQELSVGEQQRIAIARALVNRPSLILADEPTSALDDRNTEQVIQLLEHQADAENASLILVTHDKRLKDYFANHINLSA